MKFELNNIGLIDNTKIESNKVSLYENVKLLINLTMLT